jgi:HEAT repeat protein
VRLNVVEEMAIAFNGSIAERSSLPLPNPHESANNSEGPKEGASPMRNTAIRQVTGQNVPEPIARRFNSPITKLIDELSSPRSAERERARDQLVAVGEPAVAELVATCETADDRGRLEIYKALTEISDTAAIPILIRGLEDGSQDIRWVAAEGLLNVGAPTVEPLMLALIDKARDHTILDGALHVLRGLSRRGAQSLVKPLISAIRGPEPGVHVPPAAETALSIWRQETHPKTTNAPRRSASPIQESGSDQPWYDRRR